MMDGGMGSMMAWMMGVGIIGWVLIIALLASIAVLLFQLLTRRQAGRPRELSSERREVRFQERRQT